MKEKKASKKEWMADKGVRWQERLALPPCLEQHLATKNIGYSEFLVWVVEAILVSFAIASCLEAKTAGCAWKAFRYAAREVQKGCADVLSSPKSHLAKILIWIEKKSHSRPYGISASYGKPLP